MLFASFCSNIGGIMTVFPKAANIAKKIDTEMGKRIAVFSGLGSKPVTFVSCFFFSFLCRKISLNEGNIYFLILLEGSIQKFKHICKFFAIQHFYECSLSKTYDNAFLNCTLSIMYFNFYAFLKIFWEFSSCSSY